MESLSPVASYLGTNYAASEEEKLKVKSFLIGRLTKLATLDEAIAQAETHHKALLKQYGKLSAEITTHKALLVPIHYLPVDVLQKVFLNCLPTTHSAVISPIYPPLLLTHICSAWHRIAHRTEALWASIHVPVPGALICPTPRGWVHQPIPNEETEGCSHTKSCIAAVCTIACRRVGAITEWLGRSGACPLSITIYNGNPYATSDIIYNMCMILDALLPFRACWGTLKLDGTATHFTCIASICSAELPLLYALHFEGSPVLPDSISSPPKEMQSWTNSGLLRAPNLRVISYIHTMEDVTKFPLRWELLTSLKLCDNSRWGSSTSIACRVTVNHVAAILVECPLLRQFYAKIFSKDFKFGVRNDNDPCIRLPKVITLKHLAYLGISSINPPPYIYKMLNILDVPLLEHLELNISVKPPAFPSSWDQFRAFLVHKLPMLRILSLNPEPFSQKQFLACLGLCTKLEQLKLIRDLWETPPSSPGSFSQTDQENDTSQLVMMNDALLRQVVGPAPVEGEGGDSAT